MTGLHGGWDYVLKDFSNIEGLLADIIGVCEHCIVES